MLCNKWNVGDMKQYFEVLHHSVIIGSIIRHYGYNLQIIRLISISLDHYNSV
jgi:hypothetical protein